MPFVRRERTYYKYAYRDWVQPVLTANGTLGASSFAVYCADTDSYPAYYAFDNNSSTFATTHNKDFIIYSKNALNIKNISFLQRSGSSYLFKGGEIYGSNDGEEWQLIQTITGDIWDLSSNNEYYNYYKIVQTVSADFQIVQFTIKATEQYPVEVPSSSITDFGSYKYYKNVVTTKYWKEITTGSRELGYACYRELVIGTVYAYAYAKLPLGEDITVYSSARSGGTEPATSIDEISALSTSTCKWVSLEENTAKFKSTSSTSNNTLERYRDGDLYIDTTVTGTVEGTPEDYTYTTEEITPVEVSADDDYDFTEFVPSAEFDYYEDRNKLYNITKRQRDYYKYGTELDATVVGSFANIDKGVVSGFSSANYLTLPFTQADLASADNWEVVTCFTTSASSATCFSGATGTYLADFGRVHNNKFGLAYSSNGSSYNISGADPLVGTYAVMPNTKYWVRQKFTGTEYTLEYSLDGETYVKDISITSSVKLESTKDTVYCGYSSARTTSHSSIDLTKSYIKINGQDWWHGTKAVETTEADADYHVDSNKLYNFTRRNRTYYKNWTQPVNPTGITTSGWTNPTQAFDGVSDTYADTKSNSAYIEYDFGQEVYVTGFDAVGWWVNGAAHNSALDIYSVDKDGVETLIKAGTVGSASANYPTSAEFPAVKTSKVRFKTHDTLGYQVRIREITVSGYLDGTKEDYDYYIDDNKIY